MDFLNIGDDLVLTHLIAIEEKGGPNNTGFRTLSWMTKTDGPPFIVLLGG